MHLRDFIPHALQEIISGVTNAQRELGEDVVITHIEDGSLKGLGLTAVYVKERSCWAQTVEFDVAVSVVEETGGKISLNVLGLNLGGEAGRQRSNSEVTHVKFQVVMALPQQEAAKQ